jgi:outer membrane protein OmpA-like peptidoglycan-associated protein
MKILRKLLQFIPILFLLMEPVVAKSQQPFNSSIILQYGMLNYNSYQHDIFNFDSKFRSGGITYRQQLGRLSGLNFTGKYYTWSLDNINDLETYALQSMFVLHAGKISSSWRINRITPYIGAGIGYQQHSLKQEGAEFEFKNLYLPLEAGLLFNISSRWSMGVFAEYKFDFGSDIKKQSGVDKKNPDIVNSAGITLSYHFGQRKNDYSFPTVHTIPAHIIKSEDPPAIKEVIASEILKEKSFPQEVEQVTIPKKSEVPAVTFLVKDPTETPIPGAIVDMAGISGMTDEKGEYSLTYTVEDTFSYTVTATAFLPVSGKINLEGDDLLLKISMKPVSFSEDVEEETIPESETIVSEVAILPKQVSHLSDTIRIPVRVDVIVSKQVDPMAQQTDPSLLQTDSQSRMVYDQRLDSLVFIARQLRNRITSLENSNSRLVAEFNAYMSQPVTTGQQTFPSTQRSSDFDQAMLKSQLSYELELSRLKQNIELLTAELKQSSLNNQIALENLNRQITKIQTSEPQARISRPDAFKPEIKDPVKVAEPEEVRPEPAPTIKTEQDTDETIELLRLETEWLSASQKLLVEQVDALQKQNQRLLNQISDLSKQPEKPVEKPLPERLEHTINFAINSSAVGVEHLPKLAEFANLIKSNPDKIIQLSGFADGLGNPAYNMKLSQRRVQAVKSELVKMGVQNQQIVEQYFGSEQASGGKNANERRVDIRIL